MIEINSLFELSAFAYSAAGLFVGFAVGMTGVGGGSLMTPILVYVFGFSPAAAVGTDLLYAAGTKSFGVWLHGRQRTIDWRLVGLLIAGSIPGSLLTIGLLQYIGLGPVVQQIMMLTLGAAVGITAFLTLFQNQVMRRIRPSHAETKTPAIERARSPMTLVVAFFLGIVVTLCSVGAGVLGTMFLFWLYPKLSAVKIVGSDIAYAVPLTLVAGLGHMTLGTTHFDVLGYLLLGSLPGIYLGIRFGYSLPDRILRPGVACVLMILGTGMVVKTTAAVLA